MKIQITEYLDIKIRAIAAHHSQLDAREFVEMLKQNRSFSFTSKEYLYLANFKVAGKETDLFQ